MNFIYYFLIIHPLIVGILSFLTSTKTKLIQATLLLTIGISLWITALFNQYLNNEILSSNLLTFAYALTLTSFLLLTIYNKNIPIKQSKITLFFIYSPLIIIISQTFISLITFKTIPMNLTIFKYVIPIYFILYTIITTYILIKKIIKKTYHKKQKNVIYLVITGLFLITTAYNTPYICTLFSVNLSLINLYTAIILTLFLLNFLHIVIENKLYKIKTSTLQTLPFMLSLFILTASYSFIFKLTQHHFNSILTTNYYIQTGLYLSIILPIFYPLKTRFHELFEKILFKTQYNYKKILYTLSTELNQTHSNKNLHKLLNTLYINKLELKNAEILIPNNYFNDSNIQNSFTPYFNTINNHQIQFSNTEIEFLSTHKTHTTLINDFIKKFPEKETIFKNYTLILSSFNQNKKLITVTLLGQKLSQNPFNTYDYQLFISINEAIYQTIDRIKNQRITSQINLAKRVQEELTPRNISIKNCSSSTFFKSCSEVGGDFLDYHKRDNNEWIILGDVTGLGIGAGMVVLMIQSIFSTLIHSAKITEPNKLNDLANSILLKNFKRLQDPLPLTIACIHTTDGKHFSVHGTHEHLFIYTYIIY